MARTKNLPARRDPLRAQPARLAGPDAPPASLGGLSVPQLGGEYVSGGPVSWSVAQIPFEETPFDRAVQQYGLSRVVNLMLADSKVGGTIDSVKTAVLADGIDVTPAILPKFGTDSDEEYSDEDAKNAFEAGQFVARCLDRLVHPFALETTLWQLLDGMVWGCKLGEMVFVEDSEGIDAGKLVLDRIKVKSQRAWSYALDRSGNVIGIVGGYFPPETIDALRKPGDGERIPLLPREKFAVFTWNPQEDDPRGRTMLRRVYDPFFRKFQTLAKRFKYISKFAGPSWVGMVGPNQQPRAERDATTGKVKTSDRSPEQDMLASLIAMESNSALAVANGASAKPEFPNGNGEAFHAALAYEDKQIVSAILFSARATEEAQFGSRADSESAQDSVGTLVRHVKLGLARMIRQDIARILVLLNWGKDWADRYTPLISLGKTEHQDFSRNAGAMAKLAMAGLLQESQRPGICTFLGLPLPKPKKDGVDTTIGPKQPDPSQNPKPASGNEPSNKGAATDSKPKKPEK